MSGHRASEERTALDPMTLRVLGGAFGAIAKEMAQVIFRTAFFQIIREAEDLGAGLYTADGQEIAESETTAMHCGSIGAYLRGIREVWGVDISDGDVFLRNDPRYGASHLADVCVAIPIFWNGRLIAWAADTAHLADLGSASAGLCTDAFAEGRNYRALKLERAGERNAELVRHIFDNVRTPEINRGDIEALYTAAQLGARRFRSLLERYGDDVVMAAADAWMAHCERLLRREIERMPDGDYVAPVQWMDDDGRHRDHPLNINVTVVKRGSDITIDLSGGGRDGRQLAAGGLDPDRGLLHHPVDLPRPGDPRRLHPQQRGNVPAGVGGRPGGQPVQSALPAGDVSTLLRMPDRGRQRPAGPGRGAA
jgi:N-methylhydantoinase B